MSVSTANTFRNIVPAFASKMAQNGFAPMDAAVIGYAQWQVLRQMEAGVAVAGSDMVELVDGQIARLNKMNKSAVQFNGKQIVNMMLKDNLLTKDGTLSDKAIDMFTVPEQTLPLTEPVTDENRRKFRIKGGKGKPSPMMAEAMDFLESTAYCVDAAMLEIVKKLRNDALMNDQKIDALEDGSYVINGSDKMAKFDRLYSEYFADTRGRLYHVACAGPNPQSSDLARALYNLADEDIVKAGTEAHDMFRAELFDCAGRVLSNNEIKRIAMNPVGCLKAHFAGQYDLKKPFTVVKMALIEAEFMAKGEADVRVGIGLDAKCSGTQYLAFVAGDMHMAKATGLCNSEEKEADPYVQSLVLLKYILESSDNPLMNQIADNEDLTRNFIKTPYMAVQYGGGIGALVKSRDFRKVALDFVMKDERLLKEFAENCITAIKTALGTRINLFIENMAQTCAGILETTGKHTLAYRHSDGFKVYKTTMPKVELSAYFKLKVGARAAESIDFGSEDHVHGDHTPWTVRSAVPTADECSRTFLVNYIQGIDALVARACAVEAKNAGLKGYTSIHDCFRVRCSDAPKLMKVIREGYKKVFVETDQFAHIENQLGGKGSLNMLQRKNIVTNELLDAEEAYYFCV